MQTNNNQIGMATVQNMQPSLSERDLKRLREYVHHEVGIQLPESKQTLVEGRLRKRLRELGFTDYKEYLDYVLGSREGQHERLHLIDVLTTNKTDFFREPDHFQYLTQTSLVELEKILGAQGRRELAIWSAGCSSGEEAYTLAIVLNESIRQHPKLKFSILATDISKTVLQTARAGIYPENRIEPVEMMLRQKYFLRSENPAEALVRMGPELRRKIKFGSLNLIARSFGLQQKMDVIFCRNVMIYFNSEIREALVQRFEQQLIPGGYLFVGHSESLNGLSTGLKQVAPMVYRKACYPEMPSHRDTGGN